MLEHLSKKITLNESAKKSSIIGLGNIAWKLDLRKRFSYTHAKAYFNHPNFHLTSGYSPDANDRKAFTKSLGVRSYPNILEMIENEKPWIVSVCSPVEAHKDNFLELLSIGVDKFWLEKPAFENLTDMEEGLRELKKYPNVKVCVNFIRRFLEPFIFLKDYIKNHNVKRIVTTYSMGIKENGIHVIDLIGFLLNIKEFELDFIDNTNLLNPSFKLVINNNCACEFIGTDLKFHDICVTIFTDKDKIFIDNNLEIKFFEKANSNKFSGNSNFVLKNVIPMSNAFNNYSDHVLDAINSESAFLISNLETAKFSNQVIDMLVNK